MLQYGLANPDKQKDDRHVTVRIVSGDHMETAKKVAVDAGIVDV